MPTVLSKETIQALVDKTGQAIQAGADAKTTLTSAVNELATYRLQQDPSSVVAIIAGALAAGSASPGDTSPVPPPAPEIPISLPASTPSSQTLTANQSLTAPPQQKTGIPDTKGFPVEYYYIGGGIALALVAALVIASRKK